MPSRLEPNAESICRLCRTVAARVRFTDHSNVIDVCCPHCGAFRVEIPGYHIDLNALTCDQRTALVAFVGEQHEAGDVSPLITRDLLQRVTGIDIPR